MGNTSKDIAGAIIVVGLAGISASSWIVSGGDIGTGWAILAVLSLFAWDWSKN